MPQRKSVNIPIRALIAILFVATAMGWSGPDASLEPSPFGRLTRSHNDFEHSDGGAAWVS